VQLKRSKIVRDKSNTKGMCLRPQVRRYSRTQIDHRLSSEEEMDNAGVKTQHVTDEAGVWRRAKNNRDGLHSKGGAKESSGEEVTQQNRTGKAVSNSSQEGAPRVRQGKRYAKGLPSRNTNTYPDKQDRNGRGEITGNPATTNLKGGRNRKKGTNWKWARPALKKKIIR